MPLPILEKHLFPKTATSHIALIGLSLGLIGMVANLAACSGGDDDDNSAVARKKCVALVQRLCASVASCEVEGGLIEASQEASEKEECVSSVTEDTGCARAVDVTDSYDECLSRLADPPCDAVNQSIAAGSLDLPESCDDVILVKD